MGHLTHNDMRNSSYHFEIQLKDYHLIQCHSRASGNPY